MLLSERNIRAQVESGRIKLYTPELIQPAGIEVRLDSIGPELL